VSGLLTTLLLVAGPRGRCTTRERAPARRTAGERSTGSDTQASAAHPLRAPADHAIAPLRGPLGAGDVQRRILAWDRRTRLSATNVTVRTNITLTRAACD
jgi:hypothetical protein